MTTALVTGPFDHTQGAAVAFKNEGFDVYIWAGSSPGTSERPAPGLVDCYIQLPPGLVRTAPLVHRLDTLSAVAPLLAPDAAVVLVAGESDREPSRRQALRTLAEAAVADQSGPGRQVIVVDSGDMGQIAAVARHKCTEAQRASLADLAPGLPYADWRHEVMNLTSSACTTYFGWRRPDGAGRAAVLRRSVLSPLADADDGDPGLARAVLSDAFGASALGDLQESDTCLVDDFLHEVIRPLSAEGFELPSHIVAAWVVRRSLSLSV